MTRIPPHILGGLLRAVEDVARNPDNYAAELALDGGIAAYQAARSEPGDLTRALWFSVTENGGLTTTGRELLADLRDDITKVLDGHNDNTGTRCRTDITNAINPAHGHDCCYVCNRVGAAFRAAMNERAEQET